MRQGTRWIRGGIALAMLAGGCAWAWAQGAAGLPAHLLPLPGWTDRLMSPPQRGWLLIPAGLLALAFTASRTVRSGRWQAMPALLDELHSLRERMQAALPAAA